MASDTKIELVNNTGSILSALSKQIEQALEAMGQRAETYAKNICPVDTGRLKNSISHAVENDGQEEAAYIGTNVEYGPYVECGTSRQKAEPYLRPAVADHANEYQQIAMSYLKQ